MLRGAQNRNSLARSEQQIRGWRISEDKRWGSVSSTPPLPCTRLPEALVARPT